MHCQEADSRLNPCENSAPPRPGGFDAWHGSENRVASSSNEIAIFLPLVIGLPVTFATIVIHGLAVLVIVNFVRHEMMLGRAGVGFWKDLAIVSGAVLVALAAHLVEITVWALVLELCSEFPHFAPAFYQSAMNYTSLSYGDVVMPASWRLLGPLETADGLLMFGVSTAMIFAVIQRLVRVRFGDIETEPSERQRKR